MHKKRMDQKLTCHNTSLDFQGVNFYCIHGPLSLGGLNIASLAKEQAQSHLERFIGHMRRQDTVSQHLRISLNILQLTAGCRNLFLWNNPAQYNYVDQNNRLGYAGNDMGGGRQ